MPYSQHHLHDRELLHYELSQCVSRISCDLVQLRGIFIINPEHLPKIYLPNNFLSQVSSSDSQSFSLRCTSATMPGNKDFIFLQLKNGVCFRGMVLLVWRPRNVY